MQIGIIGLPLSGKTTIFNALTRGHAEVAAFSSGKLEVHTANVQVPDARVDVLSEIFKPRKTIHAQVQYNDIAGLARGIGEKGGLDGSLLNQIVQNDALVEVIRAFENPNIPHLDGSVDPKRDLENLDTELILSDLGVIERRIDRLKTSLAKGGSTPQEREGFNRELAQVEKFQATLENGLPLVDLDLNSGQIKQFKSLALVTIKPRLIILNSSEEEKEVKIGAFQYSHKQSILVALQGQLEMELAQMSDDEQNEFLSEFGIAEPSLPRVIHLSYQLLGLQSFFTVGEDEVRAWTIPVGATAVDAAGAIHTDLARGFIRAEVISYADMIACGNLVEAKRRGVLRLEGKEYIVQDGDILNIRFAV